jgi:PilZ domain
VERQPAALLKVRFAALSQLQAHLHLVEGRTVFFFREPFPRLVGGDRAIVEFSVVSSEQVSTLRGTVLGRVDVSEGAQVGAWIEFPDTKLAKRLERGAAALATRQHQRVICDVLVEVRQGAHSFVARMMDVSLGGARILGATAPRVGAMPLRSGSTLTMKIVGAVAPFPADLGRADVVRADSSTGELAVRWVRSDPVVRVASLKLIDAVRRSWTQAQEMTHAPPCCGNGQVLDPPMPALRGRL